MKTLRKSFTKWYIRKGYTFGYEQIFPLITVWNCPWYVKPLLFLFSPSTYFYETTKIFAENFAKGFMEGNAKGLELKETTEDDGE
jgi:hypothetical protein